MTIGTGHVMIRETMRLGADLRDLAVSVAQPVRTVADAAGLSRMRTLFLVGNGDSAHAATGAEWAFDHLRVRCEAMRTQRFADHGLASLVNTAPGSVAVIVLSASGGTPAALQVVSRAKAKGAVTIGVTATAGSELTRVADLHVVAELPEKEPSPGIRTYQAGMCVLMRLAMAVAAGPTARALESEMDLVAGHIECTVTELLAECAGAAGVLARSPAVLCLGSGSQAGTAAYAAAKLVEGSGIPAFAQDLDEWRHVDRLIDPQVPLIIIAAPGETAQLAAGVAVEAHRSGRCVIAVAPAGALPATFELPVRGTCHEALSPLLYSVFAPLLAAAVGNMLGRVPFHYRHQY